MRWSPSVRLSRANPPDSRCRRCWSGTGRRSHRRSRPTCSRARSKRRQTLGPVFVFDPFGLGGMAGNTWSVLRAARTWDGALESAWRLAAAGELDQRGVDGGDFWAVAAEQRLAPLLFTAAASGLGMDAVVRWAYGQGSRELDEAIARVTGSARDRDELEGAHAAYDALRAFERQADRTRTSIEATAQGLLRAYRFTRVLRSAASCEIVPDALLEQRSTLYLIGDAKASKLLRPIFLALLSELVDRAYERATLAGGRLELPLLAVPRRGRQRRAARRTWPRSLRPRRATTSSSSRSSMTSPRHGARYGRQAETVVNSHRARMLLPGVADLDTLQYFAGLAGEEEARDLSSDHRRGLGRRDPHQLGPAPTADRRRGAAPAARASRAAALRPPAAGTGAAAHVVRRPAVTKAGGAVSFGEPDDRRHGEESDDDDGVRWPLTWRGLYPRERWLWFERLWTDVCGAARALPARDPLGLVGGRGPTRDARRARGVDRSLRLGRVG